MVIDAATDTQFRSKGGDFIKNTKQQMSMETLHEIQNSPGALTPFA